MNETIIQNYIDAAIRAHHENRYDDCKDDALIAIAMCLSEIANKKPEIPPGCDSSFIFDPLDDTVKGND